MLFRSAHDHIQFTRFKGGLTGLDLGNKSDLNAIKLRAAAEILLARYPLLLDYEILSRIGSVNYIHSIMGILLTAVTILISFKIFTMSSKDLKLLSGFSLLLILLQIIIGSSMEIFGLPPVLQVFHLWIASIFIGIILIQYVELKYMSEAKNA